MDRSAARRLSLPVAVGALFLLLAVLATLQYRWLGQVAEAERQRLQSVARTRVEQLAADLDREVTRAWVSLRLDRDMLEEGGGARFAARYESWAARAEHPALVAGVYALELGEDGARLRRFDPARRDFVEAEWPAGLDDLQSFLAGTLPPPLPGDREGPRPLSLGFAAADPPTLFAPLAEGEGAGADGARPSPGEGRPASARRRDDEGEPRRWREARPGDRLAALARRQRGATLVVLDTEYLARDLLPALARRHLVSEGDFDYALVVRTRSEPSRVVHRPEGEFQERAPDASTGLLALRFDLVDAAALRAGQAGLGDTVFRRRPPRDPWRVPPGEAARRGPPPEGRRPPPGDRGPRGGGDRGLWEARVIHRGGPLEEVVAHVRRRNLAVSTAILVLLGASVAMIVVSSQRARRLAEQQVEFVAGVSHELRTPVAVVCSAGENLADGVVHDPAEVRLYGATIRDEGRRLAEMVEQVLEFAGIDSRERRQARAPVRLSAVVEEAARASAGAIREAGAALEADVPADLPPVMGDRAALRRAVQNLLQNAARHAAGGRWIGVSARVARGGRGQEVRLTVRDRGPGITPAERGRLFEPFFRGRQALASGVTGSGLGLSLVKRIAEAHGGAVEVESAPGGGAAFTLVLPAAPARADERPTAEENDAQADPAR